MAVRLRRRVELAYAALEAYVVARARADQPAAEVPVWRGQLLGKEFGLDQQYLTVAGVKLPSFLLALLPLATASVSPEQSKAAERRNEQRRDRAPGISAETHGEGLKQGSSPSTPFPFDLAQGEACL